MAYTINQGYQQDRRLDWLQRGLLIGLPILALILSFGAFRHNGSPGGSTSQNPKLIPIISSLSDGKGSGIKSNSGSSSPSGGSASTGTTPSSSTLSGPAGNTGGGTISNPGTTPIVGGRGGGPTGGSGGIVSIPDCSLNQLATVTCKVPACSPELTLQPGQKAILGINGTCVVVN